MKAPIDRQEKIALSQQVPTDVHMSVNADQTILNTANSLRIVEDIDLELLGILSENILAAKPTSNAEQISKNCILALLCLIGGLCIIKRTA